MPFETITYDLADGVATIALNRPEVMNALSRELRGELLQAVRRSAAEARALVLTGTGRAFCSGQDLGNAAAIEALDLEKILNEEYVPLLQAITESPIPVIAAVNGVAAGAGANLALAADVVIACDSACFIQAFTRIGLVPDAGGTYWLPRQIGLARSMGAMLFAETISARQAVDWGMIYESVPDADFAAHVAQRAAHLAVGPTVAYRGIKALLRASSANELQAQLALEAQVQGQCGTTDDFREGVAAFLQKRKPRFTGA